MGLMNLRPRRNLPKKTIGIHDLCRIIGKTENVKIDEVSDVLYCLTRVIILALENGYTVKLPSLGTFSPQLKDGIKKGDRVRVPFKDRVNEEDYGEGKNELKKLVIDEEGTVWLEYLKSSNDYIIPNFKFSKAIKEKLKEDTIEWQ